MAEKTQSHRGYNPAAYENTEPTDAPESSSEEAPSAKQRKETESPEVDIEQLRLDVLSGRPLHELSSHHHLSTNEILARVTGVAGDDTTARIPPIAFDPEGKHYILAEDPDSSISGRLRHISTELENIDWERVPGVSKSESDGFCERLWSGIMRIEGGDA